MTSPRDTGREGMTLLTPSIAFPLLCWRKTFLPLWLFSKPKGLGDQSLPPHTYLFTYMEFLAAVARLPNELLKETN